MKSWTEVSFMLGSGYESAFLANICWKILVLNVLKQ